MKADAQRQAGYTRPEVPQQLVSDVFVSAAPQRQKNECHKS